MKDFKKRTEEFCKFRPSTIEILEICSFFQKQVKIASEKHVFNLFFFFELDGWKIMAKISFILSARVKNSKFINKHANSSYFEMNKIIFKLILKIHFIYEGKGKIVHISHRIVIKSVDELVELLFAWLFHFSFSSKLRTSSISIEVCAYLVDKSSITNLSVLRIWINFISFSLSVMTCSSQDIPNHRGNQSLKR